MPERKRIPLTTVADAVRWAAEHGYDLVLALDHERLLGEVGHIVGRGRTPGTNQPFVNVHFTAEQVEVMVERLGGTPPH